MSIAGHSNRKKESFIGLLRISLRNTVNGGMKVYKRYEQIQFNDNIKTALSLPADHALRLSRQHPYQSRNSDERGYFSYQ